MKREEVDYLTLSERGFLATVGSSGAPTIVPVCFVYDGGKIYTAIDQKPKKTKSLSRLANIRRNSRVAFIVDNYSDDWDSLSYLLLHGSASVLRVGDEAARAKELLIKKYPQYRRLPLDSAQVIAIEVRDSKFWSFAGN